MYTETTKAATKQLLMQYYQMDAEEIPPLKAKSEFIAADKLGFFLGIVEYGTASHLAGL
jgi:hypothetical protein